MSAGGRPARATIAAALATLALVALAPLAAPPARAETARDYAAARLDGGGDAALRDWRGSVVLLNGWATWCNPCRAEMPFLGALQRDYAADGLRVVGVSIDRADADSVVRDFVEETGVTFTILRDPRNEFARAFRATGVPETLLIGRDGEVLYRWKGPLDMDPQATRAVVEQALVAEAGAGVAVAAPMIGMPVAFLAGMLSFLSPCVLPLIPTYAAVVTGLSLSDLEPSAPPARARARRAALANGLVFVAGFSLVFIALGASATLLGGLLADNRVWIARVGGVILAILGLHLLGLLKLPFVERTVRVEVADRPAGRFGTLLIGVAFGAGWTPCIGPALASILTLAATSGSVLQGVGLLSVYSLGLAIPFLLATVALDRFLIGSARLRRWLPRLQKASGALMLLVAALLLTDSLSRLAAFAARFAT